MHVIAVTNQKGGVAKTTTCANLGAALALRGERVLVMDLDPQANLTLGLQAELSGLPYALPDVLLDPASHPLARLLRPVLGVSLPLALAAGHMDMARCEAALARRDGAPYSLRDALADPRIRGAFTWVIVDCPPSLGLLTQNALCASDYILVPTEAKMYAFAGMAILSQMLEDLAATYAMKASLLGVLLTMYEEGTRLQRTIADVIRDRFGDKVFHTVIHRNIRLSEAEAQGSPAAIHDPRARGAREYASLAEEVVARVSADAAAGVA